MDGLTNLASMALWVVVGVAILTFALTVLGKLRRKRLLAQAKEQILANPDQMHALQAELLEVVRFNSENQRQAVNISAFWLKYPEVSRPLRTALIEELIGARIVAAVPPAYENAFIEFMAMLWADYFCLPPRTLILSDRDWLFMVHSRVNGHQVLVERMVVTVGSNNTNNTVNTGGGSATGVVQGGAASGFKVHGNSFQRDNLDESQIRRLILALQLDSELTPDPSLAKRIRAHAELLEQELEEPGTSDSKKHLLDRIISLVGKSGDAMNATMRVLSAFTPEGS